MNISKTDKAAAAEALRAWFISQELDGADAVRVCLQFIAMCTGRGAHSWAEAKHALEIASREMEEATICEFLDEELKRLAKALMQRKTGSQ